MREASTATVIILLGTVVVVIFCTFAVVLTHRHLQFKRESKMQ